MGREIRGKLAGDGLRFGIVVARFNELITSRLLSGARDAFLAHGVREEDIDVAWTPGSFELPLVAKKLAQGSKYAAVICLGAVIKGGTPHYQYIASQAASGIGAVALETGVPVIFGVLTTETVEQALERSGVKLGNRGYDAALSAIEMANLLRSLETR